MIKDVSFSHPVNRLCKIAIRRRHIVFVFGILAWSFNGVQTQTNPSDRSKKLMEKALQILEKTPLIDGHNDLPGKIREKYKNHLDSIDIASSTKEIKMDIPFQTDIPRLRQGHVGGVFFVAYVPAGLGPAAAPFLFEQIDLIQRIAANYSTDFTLALTAADVQRIHKSGKIAVLIGIENGDAISNSLAVLRQAYNCGARYLTLTHVKTTDWADACDWDAYHVNQAIHGGLTPFGREVIREMNRLGMMVDLSHVSDSTAIDALKTSVAPVIFSHSCARALCNHPRNVPDDILRLLKANNGIIMLNFMAFIISEKVRIAYLPTDLEWKRLSTLYPNDQKRAEQEFFAWASGMTFPQATISQLVDHIDHIRKVAGINHIGLGSDFDGCPVTPIGLEDVSGYPELIIELLNRNYSAEDIAKIAGGNILRVMRTVENISLRLEQHPPSEALIGELDKAGSAPLEK